MKTTEEIRNHFKYGYGDEDKCYVCGGEITGTWTDYNGQIKCLTCGTTYQIISCKLSDEVAEKYDIDISKAATKYCDCFDVVDLLKDYWDETGNKIPFGCFIGRSPIPNEDYDKFNIWLWANVDRYREDYKEMFDWDGLEARYASIED